MIDLAPANPYALPIATPLIAAAGSLGYGVEAARMLNLGGPIAGHGLGAIITRSTSLNPRRAHPLPEIHETPAGIWYSGGEHNPGLRTVLKRNASAWAAWPVPIIVSLFGTERNECADAATMLEGVEGVRGIELPLARNAAATPESATRLLRQVRQNTLLPLIAKLPPDAPDPVALAHACVAAGADALSLMEGMPAALPGHLSRDGFLCGPALLPISLRLTKLVCAAVEVPVIAGGGVQDSIGARALLEAGATAVSMATTLLHDPRRAATIAAEIGEEPVV
jgi:dihydroorotate dehydrogenase (NAD+) catalytic subunit